MKKAAWFLSSMMAAAAAFNICSTAFSASAAESIRILGDLNHDLIVDSCDAQKALEIYTDSVSGLTDGSVSKDNETADINMDGFITAEDAENILLYYCQTLVGNQPLWAEFRTVIQEDGSNYKPSSVYEEDGEDAKFIHEFAQTGMYIELGCVSGKPGETVKVPVYVAGLPKLAGFQLEVRHELPLKLIDITTDIENHEEGNPEYSSAVANPNAGEDSGIIVWAEAGNLAVQDGYVIAEFSYVIPENAAEGTHYCVSVDQSYTKFVMCGEDEPDTEKLLPKKNEDGFFAIVSKDAYQYTALSGVVTVK